MENPSRPYTLVIGDEPLKYLERLRRKDAQGIDRDLRELARDPGKKAGVVSMRGKSESEFKMRCGKYRVIFKRDDTARLQELGHEETFIRRGGKNEFGAH